MVRTNSGVITDIREEEVETSRPGESLARPMGLDGFPASDFKFPLLRTCIPTCLTLGLGLQES